MTDRYDEQGWVLTEEGQEIVADMVVELAVRGYKLDSPPDYHDAATFLVGMGFDYGVTPIKVLLAVGHADVLLKALREDMENGEA